MKHLIKKIVPSRIKKQLNTLYKPIARWKFQNEIKHIRKLQEKTLQEVRKKDKINVAFFAIWESVWKYEEVYNLFKADTRFNVTVFVCPVVNQGHSYMVETHKRAFAYFKNNGYNVIKTYDIETNSYLDIKQDFDLDIIFYTNPYRGLIHEKYYIDQFKENITCYVPYTFQVSNLYDIQYNGFLQNNVWSMFLPTKTHVLYAKRFAWNKGVNTIFTGYPGLDKLAHYNFKQNKRGPWKSKSSTIKRIIWAPHHTIKGKGANLNYSSFLRYADFFLEIAEKYQDRIEIAFKPHPILRANLNYENVWGMKKTNDYFNTWKKLKNGILSEGEYINLFSSSDAMIHDSSSFTVEYIMTKKPSMFLLNDNSVKERMNDIGQRALDVHYKGYDKKSIISFIEDVVLGEQDTLFDKRLSLIKEELTSPNSKSASQNIYDYINIQLKKHG